LKIPYYVFDLENEFKKWVIEYFLKEYSRGRTPNPCVICNTLIKWGVFLERAKEMKADFIATGHYAKIGFSRNKKRFILKEAEDKEKDQSYFLFNLSQDKLSRTILPLGRYNKSEVRKLAEELGLSVYNRTESQDICFGFRDNKHFFFSNNFPKIKPGLILNRKGTVLGKHKGIVFYTVGQREGLGIGWHVPLYVTKIDAKKNVVVVGERNEVLQSCLKAKNLNWVSIDKPKDKIRVEARIRYRHLKAHATLFPREDNSVRVVFDTPQFAITPGQAVVFYKKDLVLGGGWIE
ncbi:MAG: tRNA 2-thiouridine(34) synthase MnmA, partial [Candidatus Omnitrophica bacterium]|nr:tRNA 2-thiouridine(34) synthase MnmA [Candidatus Omnitrophota bacterium]